MQRRERLTPLVYHNQQLMNDLNEFMMNVKVHLFDLPSKRSKPDLSEIDQLTSRLMQALRKDSEPIIKY